MFSISILTILQILTMASPNPKVEFIYTILKAEYNTTSVSRENIQHIVTIIREFESGIEHSSITTQNKTNPSDLLYKYEQEIRRLKQELSDEKETLEELRTSYIQLKRDCDRLMN